MDSIVKTIPLSQIQPSRHQARKAFDDAGITGLAESMKQEGLLNPLVVRDIGGSFELISGERRLRAAKLLNWVAIEAKVIQTVSEAEAAAKGLVENLQREDLNPVEEAAGFRELNQLDEKYWTQEKIGSLVGKGQVYVSRSLALLGLPEQVLESMRQRILGREHGVELLRINNANSQKGMANEIIKGGWSVKQTRAAIDRLLGKGRRQTRTAEVKARKLDDPLAGAWGDIQARTKGWAWTEEYPEELAWQFSINLTPLRPDNPKKALGQWFLAMAEAFGETRLDHKTEKMVDVTNAVSAAYGDILRKIQDGSINPTQESAKNS